MSADGGGRLTDLMPITVDVADDAEKFLATDLLVWAEGRTDLSTEQILSGMRPEQRFAARADGATGGDRYLGVYGVYPLTLSVPGPLHTVRQIPVAGLTWVGVHPDERRKGVLSGMIRDHFARTGSDKRSSGLSALHASEPVIYGRFGYGVASTEAKATLGRGTELVAPGLDDAAGKVTVRLLRADSDEALELTRRAALRAGAQQLGVVVRPPETYRNFATEGPASLREKEPLRALIAEQDGEPVGYAWLRRKPKWEDGQPKGEVEVGELAGTPAAQLALWRRLVDLDLMATTAVYGRGPDDLVLPWTQGARDVMGTRLDSLWVRLVDLPVAMASRGYAGVGEVVLEVTDATLPEQSGRWLLRVSDDGSGVLERTSADAEIALTTAQLATTYLGGGSLSTLARAGVVTEQVPGAGARADALLAMPTAPTGAAGF